MCIFWCSDGCLSWVFTQTLELYLLSSLINPLSLSPWPLKTATEQFREAGIKYKWGFPFAPIMEIDGMPHKGTRKGEVEPVLTLLKLKVPWEEDELNMGDLQEPKARRDKWKLPPLPNRTRQHHQLYKETHHMDSKARLPKHPCLITFSQQLENSILEGSSLFWPKQEGKIYFCELNDGLLYGQSKAILFYF